MMRIDKIIASNELTIQLVAAIPTFTIIGAMVYAYTNNRGLQKNQKALGTLREISIMLNNNLHHNKEVGNYDKEIYNISGAKQYMNCRALGKVFTETQILYKTILTMNIPTATKDNLLFDLYELTDGNLSPKQKLNVINRIYNLDGLFHK